MDLYLRLFEVLFPVFFVVGIGYYLGKKNPKLDTTFITNFGANIGSPAIVFYSVTTTGLTFKLFADYFFYYLLAIVGFSIIGVTFLLFLAGLTYFFPVVKYSKSKLECETISKNYILENKNLNKINKKRLGMLSTNFCNGGNEIYEIENLND